MRNEQKTLTQLRRGDIMYLKIPYEENTKDYYNGYKPKEIRSQKFEDRFGRSAKNRMVIYMGRDGGDMLYLPLTSQHGSNFDKLHQYRLKDNSMTPRTNPNMKSYVEVDSLRAVRVGFSRPVDYIGRITKQDMDNIYHRVSQNALHMEGIRDRRGVIPEHMVPMWENELKHRGFKEITTNADDRRIFENKQGQVVSRTRYGMAYYHNPMTKEEVHRMVGEREHRTLPPLPDEIKKHQYKPNPVKPTPHHRPPKQYDDTKAKIMGAINKKTNIAKSEPVESNVSPTKVNNQMSNEEQLDFTKAIDDISKQVQKERGDDGCPNQ